jgi:hypothetical protein
MFPLMVILLYKQEESAGVPQVNQPQAAAEQRMVAVQVVFPALSLVCSLQLFIIFEHMLSTNMELLTEMRLPALHWLLL